MSKGEFNSVAQVNGGIENMINWDGKDKDTLALIKYIPFRYTFRSAPPTHHNPDNTESWSKAKRKKPSVTRI